MFKEVIDEFIKLIKDPANDADLMSDILNRVPSDLLVTLGVLFKFSEDTKTYRRFVVSEDFTRVYIAYNKLNECEITNGKYYFTTTIFFRGKICTVIMVDYDTMFMSGNEKEAIAAIACIVGDAIESIKLRHVQYLKIGEPISAVFKYAFPMMLVFIITRVYRCNEELFDYITVCVKEMTDIDIDSNDIIKFSRLKDDCLWLDNSLIAGIDTNPSVANIVEEEKQDEETV